MNLKRLFDLKDINYWLLASGFALDAILTVILLFALFQFLISNTSTVPIIQMILMGGLFIVNFATAWLVGRMADDMKGPTYGVVSSFSSMAIVLFALVPSGGIFGLLAAFVVLAGGFNGGITSLPRGPRRK